MGGGVSDQTPSRPNPGNSPLPTSHHALSSTTSTCKYSYLGSREVSTFQHRCQCWLASFVVGSSRFLAPLWKIFNASYGAVHIYIFKRYEQIFYCVSVYVVSDQSWHLENFSYYRHQRSMKHLKVRYAVDTLTSSDIFTWSTWSVHTYILDVTCSHNSKNSSHQTHHLNNHNHEVLNPCPPCCYWNRRCRKACSLGKS
jgi:hypothetical protein